MGYQDMLAAKMAKRNEIMREIRRLNGKLRETREVMQGLNDCKRSISMNVNSWNSACGSFEADEICKTVYVTDTFEGNIAEGLGGEIPGTTALMRGSCGQMESLCGHIGRQITILEEYIEKLQNQIQLLYSQLAAL
ncbi:MAG: hypothetical protein Q4D94_05870 [Bacillota bacterium]|nr:hypothetical protein [Bacillota bacterium]